jgi:Condensation domain
MTEKVVVQFAGDGSGVAELSWGQQQIWSVIQAKDNSLPMGGARALPPGQTVADVAAGLRFIMSRHQALRTRLRFGPDGQTQQAVHASGAITLEVVDAGDSDPGEVAAAVAAEYKARKYDYENEWPLRMAVITHDGNATHVVQMICHIALDAFGLAVLYGDFDHRDERTGPVTAMQPMEQASRQHGPSGRRAHEASMRYLERLAASARLPWRDRDGRPVRGSGQTGLAVRAPRVQARLLRSGGVERGVRAASGRARGGAGLGRDLQRPPGAQPRTRRLHLRRRG